MSAKAKVKVKVAHGLTKESLGKADDDGEENTKRHEGGLGKLLSEMI